MAVRLSVKIGVSILVLLLAALPLGISTIARADELTMLFTLPFKLTSIFAYKLTVAAIWESGLTVALLSSAALLPGLAMHRHSSI